MMKEASRSIREVMHKEEDRLSRMGKRLMTRLETKGIYNGDESHRHQPPQKALISQF